MGNETKQLTGFSSEDLARLAADMGEPSFRATQLFKGIYQRRLDTFDDFSDLPKRFREQLSDQFALKTLTLTNRYNSKDGTKRYLFKTIAGNPVEAVFIPTEKRDTICFSSQSGCALKCDFCLTAKLGFLQNLSAGEIIEQIIFVLNDVYGIGNDTPHGTNLVAMGAGEPFHNFENLIKATEIMNDPNGLFIVPDRITVSTAGVIPKIEEFSRLEKRPHLAISLSAANDELRDVLMPINKKWNIDSLMKAAKTFEQSLRRKERFTFEYVLLAGTNDSESDARQLVGLIKKYDLRRVKINLIPHNSADDIDYRASTSITVGRFKSILTDAGVDAFVRTPRGDDIFAACGQLSARENERNAIGVE